MKILFVQSEAENLSVELLSSYLKANTHQVFLFFDPLLFSSSVISNRILGNLFDIKEVLLQTIRTIKPDRLFHHDRRLSVGITDGHRDQKTF